MAGFAKMENAFPLSGIFSDNQKPTSKMWLTNNRHCLAALVLPY
jgi:hypothetical protein